MLQNLERQYQTELEKSAVSFREILLKLKEKSLDKLNFIPISDNN